MIYGIICGKRVQTFSYKMNKVWGSNIYHGDIVDNTISYNWYLLKIELNCSKKKKEREEKKSEVMDVLIRTGEAIKISD